MKEIFKHIKKFKNRYAISNFGRIKNLKTGKFLNPYLRKNGYLQIGIRLNGVRYFFLIHRLVAIHFIPNPKNKKEVNHKNSNRQDNNVINLEWCTHLENCEHASIEGNLLKGESNNQSKLSNIEVKEIKKLFKNSKAYSGIGKKYNVDRKTIRLILTNQTWRSVA